MSELEDDIRRWRETFLAREGARAEHADELEDHLRQEIGRLREARRGDARLLSEQEAFLVAARRLGRPEDLAGELARSDRGAVWRRRWIWMLCGHLGIGLAIGLIRNAAGWSAAIVDGSGPNSAIALYFLVVLAGAAGAVALARGLARSDERLPALLSRGLRSRSGVVVLVLAALAASVLLTTVPALLLARVSAHGVARLVDRSMALAWARAGLYLVPFLALGGLLWRERARSAREVRPTRGP